jgi:hypothetical protein
MTEAAPQMKAASSSQEVTAVWPFDVMDKVIATIEELSNTSTADEIEGREGIANMRTGSDDVPTELFPKRFSAINRTRTDSPAAKVKAALRPVYLPPLSQTPSVDEDWMWYAIMAP